MQIQVNFEEIGNKNIFFSLAEPGQSQRKIIIMNHGFRGSSIGPARTFVDFEKKLLASGISSLRFDQPGSGNSEGDYLDSSFGEWVKTITYFAQKYLDRGYQVVLLGQSMGASATMIATAQAEISGRIPCILLWVPDPKSSVSIDPDKTYEENGQKYKGRFWQEAHDANFFGALAAYQGGIHLVYGEADQYIPKEWRNQVIQKVKDKHQPFMILKGQNHSPWNYEAVQQVYLEELEFVSKYFV